MADHPPRSKYGTPPNLVDMLAEPMPKQKFHQRNHVRKCQLCKRLLYHSGKCIACAAQAKLDETLKKKRELEAYCARVAGHVD